MSWEPIDLKVLRVAPGKDEVCICGVIFSGGSVIKSISVFHNWNEETRYVLEVNFTHVATNSLKKSAKIWREDGRSILLQNVRSIRFDNRTVTLDLDSKSLVNVGNGIQLMMDSLE